MNKLGIWAIVVAGAFVAGLLSANPVVEGVSGWKFAIDEHTRENAEDFDGHETRITELEGQTGSSQVYEVSAVSVIPPGENFGNEVELRCLDGDRYLKDSPIFVLTIPAIVETFNVAISAEAEKQFFTETPVIRNQHETTIGFSVKTRIESAVEDRPPFEVPVTITGLCLSSSP